MTTELNLEMLCYGTEGRNRTDTPVKEPDFESGASTSSATPAQQRAAIIPAVLSPSTSTNE